MLRSITDSGLTKCCLCVPPSSTVNGTDSEPRSGSCSASNGMDGQVPSSSCSPALSHVVNGDSTPNSTPVHQPSDSDTESRTGEALCLVWIFRFGTQIKFQRRILSFPDLYGVSFFLGVFFGIFRDIKSCTISQDLCYSVVFFFV